MTGRYEQAKTEIRAAPRTWLVTGCAGFIGSNLLEALLRLDQRVIGLDNFATGFRHNLDEVQGTVTPEQWARFEFIEGDIDRPVFPRSSTIATSSGFMAEAATSGMKSSTMHAANAPARRLIRASGAKAYGYARQAQTIASAASAGMAA